MTPRSRKRDEVIRRRYSTEQEYHKDNGQSPKTAKEEFHLKLNRRVSLRTKARELAERSGSPIRDTPPRLFEPRQSLLDGIDDPDNRMYGWVNLAFIGMCWYIASSAINTYNETGQVLRGDLAFAAAERVLESFLVVGAMCSFGAFVIPLTLLTIDGRISTTTAEKFQHLMQAIMVIGAWATARLLDFGVTQSFFIIAEALVMFMKTHSYLEVHREWFQHDELRGELREGLTLWNYIDFLIVPTLVYDRDYPRTEKFRPGYFLKKAAQTVFCLIFMYVVVAEYIYPNLKLAVHRSFWENLITLIVPFLGVHLITFYIVFEGILNCCAELTLFADRAFYADWWNATTYDEYARDWNKPVHTWLLRHVYMTSRKRFQARKTSAMMGTFFFSSVLHEFVMSVVLDVYRPWFFLLQMSQIPLIAMSKPMKGTLIGNMFLWFGLTLGIPLLALVYSVEYWRKRVDAGPEYLNSVAIPDINWNLLNDSNTVYAPVL
eukprot:Clim_evm4s203 gene=Clim_evmTU4s203